MNLLLLNFLGKNEMHEFDIVEIEFAISRNRERERKGSENWIRFSEAGWFSDIAGGGSRAVLISLLKLIIEE